MNQWEAQWWDRGRGWGQIGDETCTRQQELPVQGLWVVETAEAYLLPVLDVWARGVHWADSF